MFLKIKEGKIKAIYCDEILEGMKALGTPVIKRATHVEYDNVKAKWVATTADLQADNFTVPGIVIAETDTRQEAINKEIEFLKTHL